MSSDRWHRQRGAGARPRGDGPARHLPGANGGRWRPPARLATGARNAVGAAGCRRRLLTPTLNGNNDRMRSRAELAAACGLGDGVPELACPLLLDDQRVGRAPPAAGRYGGRRGGGRDGARPAVLDLAWAIGTIRLSTSQGARRPPLTSLLLPYRAVARTDPRRRPPAAGGARRSTPRRISRRQRDLAPRGRIVAEDDQRQRVSAPPRSSRIVFAEIGGRSAEAVVYAHSQRARACRRARWRDIGVLSSITWSAVIEHRAACSRTRSRSRTTTMSSRMVRRSAHGVPDPYMAR